MPSKFVDTTAIMQVIGCVYNNPQLLDFTDKYVITDEDFPDEFHRTVFGVIYKIHELGAQKIELENVNDFLSSRPKAAAIYKKNDGDKWLLSVSEKANQYSFDYYYSRMKKMTLLRAYDTCGIDVTDIYDPDNILDTKKKQLQEDILDNSTLEELADKVDRKIDNIRLRFVDDAYGEASQAAEGIDDLIDKFKKTPEVGVPLYGSLINTVTRGARLKKFYLRSAPTGVGKAIPNDTLIPTPTGLRTVGDIRPGDLLFGQDGKPTKVLAIYPQPKKKNIWKITFSDGRIAECCGEHLWEYGYDTPQGETYRVEDTKTIYNRVLTSKNGFKNSDGNGYKFYIKVNQAVEYSEKKYKLPPYVLGAFLGNGNFRYNPCNRVLNFSSRDEEIPTLICKELGDAYYPKRSSHWDYNWTFRRDDDIHHPIWIDEFLTDYPELCNLKSEDKFIPEDYLLGSISQRKDLLAGLLDTEGSIDDKGRISFTTTSLKLRDNVIDLCRSLGYLTDKRSTKEYYTIYIQCKESEKPSLFKLEWKKNKAISYKGEEYKDHLAIVNIEKTNDLADMTCFTVDNADHLFLMNDYIVTHNTRSMIADCCYIGCNKIYDESFGWINNGVSQPCLYITTEQELEEIQTMMLAFLSNVPEDHILNGSYDGDEEDRVREAANILKNSPIYIEEMPDFSLQDIENSIKKNIRDHDVRYVFEDYIHSSLKILGEIQHRSGVNLREDNILFILSNKLKDICNQYGVFIESATQLNGSWKEDKVPDQNLLRGAKAIADKVDLGSILLPVTSEDIEALNPILSSNAFDRPVLKLSIYKNRRGRYKGCYLWCKADLGTCRINPMFATTYDYELINIENLKIVVEDEEGAF